MPQSITDKVGPIISKKRFMDESGQERFVFGPISEPRQIEQIEKSLGLSDKLQSDLKDLLGIVDRPIVRPGDGPEHENMVNTSSILIVADTAKNPIGVIEGKTEWLFDGWANTYYPHLIPGNLRLIAGGELGKPQSILREEAKASLSLNEENVREIVDETKDKKIAAMLKEIEAAQSAHRMQVALDNAGGAPDLPGVGHVPDGGDESLVAATAPAKSGAKSATLKTK